MSRQEQESAAATDQPVLVCPNCAAHNTPNIDFCQECRAPISSFSTLDPIKVIEAQGWLYRKAISGRTSPMVFWGMWLIFGPGAVMNAAVVIALLVDAFNPPVEMVFHVAEDGVGTFVQRGTIPINWSRLLGALLGVALLLLESAILYKVTESHLRYRRRQPPANGRDATRLDNAYAVAVGVCCLSAGVGFWARDYFDQSALAACSVLTASFGPPVLVIIGTVMILRARRRGTLSPLLWCAALGAAVLTFVWWTFCMG